jgi:hypothetical protein
MGMVDLDMTVRSPRVGNCAQCGREVLANIQMLSDAPIVCSKCRCLVCRIVLSTEVCRCGIAHGRPSELNQVCARCHELLQAGAFTQPSLGIVANVVRSFEAAIEAQDEMDDSFDESDEAEFSEEAVEISENPEFIMSSTEIQENDHHFVEEF